MDKELLVRRYKHFCEFYKLNPRMAVLNGSGGCVMYGVRDQAPALNIDIPDQLFNRLKNSGQYTHGRQMNREFVQWNNFIFLHRHSSTMKVYRVEDVYVYSPKDIIRQKTTLLGSKLRPSDKRAQDLLDIERLKVFMDEAQLRQKPLTPWPTSRVI